MSKKEIIIDNLFNYDEAIRYIAIYTDHDLVYKQKDLLADSSSDSTDKYEELLVNPTLITLATQRGNIDCGGLDYLVVRYGNFFQLIKGIRGGHISICLDKYCIPTTKAEHIFNYLSTNFPDLLN